MTKRKEGSICKFCGELFPCNGKQKYCSIKCAIEGSIEIDEKTGCWNWIGSIRRERGRITKEGKWCYAHRESYKVFKGEIPEGMYVCHECDNKICVNPNHLWLGTNEDNMRDMFEKGKGNRALGEANGKSKLTVDQVKVIKKLLKENEYTVTQIGKMFNICTETIRMIRDEKSWKHVKI